mgnify:CR=1 FL=1
MKYKLIDVASVIRSKNSGPYELTFDVIFKDFDMYNKVKAAKAIDEKVLSVVQYTRIGYYQTRLLRPRQGGQGNDCTSNTFGCIGRDRRLWGTTARSVDEIRV